MKKNLTLNFSILFLASGLTIAQICNAVTPVNLNTADQKTLAAIPGINKHKAQAIIEYRQDHGNFKEVHDLTHIKGFNEKILKNILKRNPGQLTVSG